MTILFGFFSDLFDTSSWPPRWHCGKWTDTHGWIYIGSDLLVWSAYFVIPLLILRYISHRNDTRFLKLYFLFAAFIFACGATHLLDAVMFWWPAYRFTAVVKLFTGIVSWATVFVLFQNLPRVFSLKSPEELEAEVDMRKKTEVDLKVKNRLLNEAQAIARIGHWEWTPGINKVSWSDSLFEIFQLDKATENLAYEHFLNSVHPEDRNFTNEKISHAVATGNFENFYHRIVLPGGEIKTIYARGETVRDDQDRVIKIIGTSQDVTDQVRVQDDLLEKTRKLESVNQELQRYAYVASHDLQEPLRKIATFVSMLQRDTSDMERMSESGRKYILKIDAAAQRMQKLIHDVLMFSSLSIREDNLELINLEKLVAEILIDFEFSIQETGAVIEVDALPQIEGYSPQMRQLLQNLISNAIKFRSPERPLRIHIFSEIISRSESILASENTITEGGRKNVVRLMIQDNGIGFEEMYRDRIFEMFQRLHNREKFEGTGIGLAICKRIAEFHQGRIEVKSEPGKGAAFILTLPLKQSK